MNLVEQDFEKLMEKSQELEGAMGAVALAVLEMFRRGGMSEEEVTALHDKMKTYFMVPTNDDCNAILKMLETRLGQEKRRGDGVWYWS